MKEEKKIKNIFLLIRKTVRKRSTQKLEKNALRKNV
jgi:hypothetical protein